MAISIVRAGDQWKCDSRAVKVVIPAWVTQLTPNSFKRRPVVEEITFEPGSQLRELHFCVFGACKSLKSICIPTSVEMICSSTDDDDSSHPPRPVERITFEPGSRLREIQDWSFYGCDSLRSICIPASVESLDGGAFVGASLISMSIESGNRFFSVNWPFLLDFAGVRLVRYFESGNEVTIPSEIETLGRDSISWCSVSAVRFESTSKLAVIEMEACYFCEQLTSISIPSSVTILCESCFSGCKSLRVVSFEADSQLIRIGTCAFNRCLVLRSIVLPAKLEILGESGFFACRKLASVIFANDSKLVRIERRAFGHCFALKSLSLPPLLEFVGEQCFFEARCLSTLAFSSPSHLRELLDSPLLWKGRKDIPDSVEVLRVGPSGNPPSSCTLAFGRESKLAEFGTSASIEGGLPQLASQQFRYFVRATSWSLKLIRSKLEFLESGWRPLGVTHIYRCLIARQSIRSGFHRKTKTANGTEPIVNRNCWDASLKAMCQNPVAHCLLVNEVILWLSPVCRRFFKVSHVGFMDRSQPRLRDASLKAMCQNLRGWPRHHRFPGFLGCLRRTNAHEIEPAFGAQ
jgi:hypothetical protein